MNVTDITAAQLNLDFDYDRMAKEMMSLRSCWIHTPPKDSFINAALEGKIFKADSEELYKKIDVNVNGKIEEKELRGQYVFYLREHVNNKENVTNFEYTKSLSEDGWDWISSIKEQIPYTISCIETLPYEYLGLVRVFVTYNTFFPTHRDSMMGKELKLSTDYDRCLGVSLIPQTGNVPMSIYSFKEDKTYDVYGNSMIFNDSAPHGVRFTSDCRITIRIFGKVDFQRFLPFINKESIIY